MGDNPRILPSQLIFEVEQYVTDELGSAQNYENRTPLDTSGVWSLHQLAARIYAQGWADGERAGAERSRGERQRASS